MLALLELWLVALVEVEQGQLYKGHCVAQGGMHHLVIIQISTSFWKILVSLYLILNLMTPG